MGKFSDGDVLHPYGNQKLLKWHVPNPLSSFFLEAEIKTSLTDH